MPIMKAKKGFEQEFLDYLEGYKFKRKKTENLEHIKKIKSYFFEQVIEAKETFNSIFDEFKDSKDQFELHKQMALKLYKSNQISPFVYMSIRAILEKEKLRLCEQINSELPGTGTDLDFPIAYIGASAVLEKSKGNEEFYNDIQKNMFVAIYHKILKKIERADLIKWKDYCKLKKRIDHFAGTNLGKFLMFGLNRTLCH
jgi:hypothetical protein